jgi:hypothetical protein
MTRFFPFTATATPIYQSDVQTASNKYDTYTDAVNITPNVSSALSTTLGALVIILQDTLSSQDSNISTNTLAAITTIFGGIALALNLTFKYKQSSYLTSLDTLVQQGIQYKYLDPSATAPGTTVVSVSPPPLAGVAAPAPLTPDQQLQADGLVRRFTR